MPCALNVSTKRSNSSTAFTCTWCSLIGTLPWNTLLVAVSALKPKEAGRIMSIVLASCFILCCLKFNVQGLKLGAEMCKAHNFFAGVMFNNKTIYNDALDNGRLIQWAPPRARDNSLLDKMIIVSFTCPG